jgi:hypothetical protein
MAEKIPLKVHLNGSDPDGIAEFASTDTIPVSNLPASVVLTNDSRMSDARTPTTHSHIPADVTGTAVITSDSRLSDARTPLAHNQTKSTITDFAHTHPESEVTNLVTDLSGKQATLVSGTNIKTVNGNSLLGSGDLAISGGAGLGYTINVQALTSSPTDAQTIYFGMMPKAPTTTAATSKVYIRKAGTIKIAEVYCYSGTAGTAEAWSLYIRKNNTTDTLIATLSVATSERVFTNSALSIAVVAGDYIEIKAVNPTWATNPLTCIFGGYIYVE